LNSLAQILRYIIYLNSLTKLTIFVLHNNKPYRYENYYFSSLTLTLAGLLLLLTASCGSYQKSPTMTLMEYTVTPAETLKRTRKNQNQYKEYFGSLQRRQSDP
jgi:hypothetical protein